MNPSEETAEARANLYRFFFQVIAEPPDEKAVDAFTDPAIRELLALIFGTKRGMVFESGEGEGPGSLAGIRQDFMDLFKVPLGAYVAPYESVYRDERDVGGRKVRGLLLGPSALAVQECYRRAGLDLDKARFKELPDHLMTELAFMEELCRREGEAWKGGAEGEAEAVLALERAFVKEHLVPWVPEVCGRVLEHARTPFYKDVARALRAFVGFEERLLATSEREA